MANQSDVNNQVTALKGSLAAATAAAGQVQSASGALQAATTSIPDHPALNLGTLVTALNSIADLLDALITATSTNLTTTTLRSAVAALGVSVDMTPIKSALQQAVQGAQSADQNTTAVNGALDVHSKMVSLLIDQSNFAGVITPQQ